MRERIPNSKVTIQKLYGRDAILAELRQKVLSSEKYRLLLRGPSGIGKTALTLRFQDDLRRNDPDYPCVRYEIASTAHPLEQALSELTASLLQQIALPEQNAEKFRAAIGMFAWDYTKTIAASALLDLTHKVLPHSTDAIKSLTKAISEDYSDSGLKATADRIARAGSEDFLSGFLYIIEALSNCGIYGTVIIDRFEVAGQRTVQGVKSLINYIPDSWAIIIAINDEKQEGIELIHELWPDMTYIGAEEMRIPPLQIPDLEQWVADAGRPAPSIDELGKILENCGGRPLFLRDWVHGISSDAVRQRVADSIGAYYLQRYQNLSQEAKRLLTFLVVLPMQTAVPFDLCTSLLNASDALSTHEVLTGLQCANFLEQDTLRPDSFRFVHELVSHCLFEQLPSAVRKHAATTILEAIADLDPDSELASEKYPRLFLSDLAEKTEMVLELALPTASELVHSGAYAMASRTYDLCSRVAKAISDPELSVRAYVGNAVVALDMGYYDQALSLLGEIPDADLQPPARAEIALNRGVALLRLNRYEEAKYQLESAQRLYESIGSIEGQLTAAKEENVILRDLGRYPEAVALAEQLVDRARDHDMSSLVTASCYRALARSLAFLGQRDRSLEAGNMALELALNDGSIRAQGNAHLAIAEAYRHGGNSESAIAHYAESLNIAKRIFNRDGALWSALGLSDAHLLCGSLLEADAILDNEVGRIVNTASTRYPLEYSHWQLSKATIAYWIGRSPIADLQSSATRYQHLGITWPLRYVETISTSGALVPKLL